MSKSFGTEYGYELKIATHSNCDCMICKNRIKKGEGKINIITCPAETVLLIGFITDPNRIPKSACHFTCMLKRMVAKDPKLIQRMVGESL